MRGAPVLVAVVAVSACTSYAKVATTNAPGIVDISTPPPFEDGSDEIVLPPVYDKPGANAYVIWLHPSFGGGMLRHGAGYEVGFGASIEKNSGERGPLPIAKTAWGLSAGVGIAQFPTDAGATRTESAPFSLEAYHRKLMFTIGAGALIYPDTRDAGAQITLRGPLCHVKARVVQDSGFEVMLAFDLNFPLVFGWSK